MFKNHPKGLLAAALSNMGERFGYYIMNAVLVLFLCSKFGLSEEKSTVIYSFFYAGIYVLSLVGGLIADRLQNYKGTIMTGLIVMSSGYALLSIPILSTSDNISWLLPLTCVALFLIAFGNGLFKGNLQAIVGQMYDDPRYSKNRDSGFQIFYVFINIGGLVAPFVAPILRGWWLGEHSLSYNAGLPALCHEYISQGASMGAEQLSNLNELVVKVGGTLSADLSAFCSKYLDIFNTGVHYSFIASVVAMLISLTIFTSTKKMLPNPVKKETKVESYTTEEKQKMAREIKQRIYALFAVLGIVVFFWFSFHQNGASLSFFARDFVKTSTVAPEIWQAINPFFVIVLTPLIMFIFSYLRNKRGIEISTPKKIGIGMGIAGIAFLFLAIMSLISDYPSANEFKSLAPAVQEGLKAGPWILIVLYFFLTVAELFISPLGLSFVSKVAPKNLQGLCQGLWLSAAAVGNGMLWIGPWLYNKYPIWQCWLLFVVLCAASMIVMLAMVKWLVRVTK